MSNYFLLNEVKKSKDGKICYRGVITLVAELCDEEEPGPGPGPGNPPDRRPPFKIEIPQFPPDLVWVYEDFTPKWAIENAEAVGYETVHHRDWWPQKPL